jgi:hypothetical protein
MKHLGLIGRVAAPVTSRCRHLLRRRPSRYDRRCLWGRQAMRPLRRDGGPSPSQAGPPSLLRTVPSGRIMINSCQGDVLAPQGRMAALPTLTLGPPSLRRISNCRRSFTADGLPRRVVALGPLGPPSLTVAEGCFIEIAGILRQRVAGLYEITG